MIATELNSFCWEAAALADICVENFEDPPPTLRKNALPIFMGGGGYHLVFLKSIPYFFSRKGEAGKEHTHTKINKFNTEINDVLKDFCQYKTELQTKKTVTEV